ncbi:MAG: sensor histidine kinase [Kiritimatiellia bacterium]
MNRRLSAVFLVVILAPVALMVWLGLRSVRLEQEQVQARLASTAMRLLSQYDAALSAVTDDIERQVLPLLAEPFDTSDAQRALVRGSRFVRQPFLIDAEGNLQIPDPQRERPLERERYFLERTAGWRRAGDVFVPEDPGSGGGERARNGWYTWFWEDGVQFAFWQRLEDGAIRGVELDRHALLAAVIAALPHGEPARAARRYSEADEIEYIALRDPRGDILYAWGSFVPENGATPWAVRALAGPLGAWQLSYYGPSLATGGIPLAALGLLFLIGAVALLMILAVVLLLREHGRAIREARQRVSFVNQVSHELKTPLTNIRMYTELLEQRIAGKDEKAEQYTGILLSESRRLGRMIHNVLSFGQHGRGTLRLHKSPGVVDTVVAQVLAHFAPAFAHRQMEVQFEAGCKREISFDADVLEQILGNLLGNAEKYAGEGVQVRVRTFCEADRIMVEVADDGPGIPDKYREEIFKPFFRLDARLVQKASGAGIGLSISRELARLHGGDLVLVPTNKGARFRVVLRVSGAACTSP